MNKAITQLYLRLAMGSGFTILGLDRLGVWGPNGKPWVSWGDWQHFSAYAHEVMGFLPRGLAEILAVVATIAEISVGILLLLGLFTRQAAFASGILTAGFAIAMAISYGITSPINYSVFTVSAAGFLLSTQAGYRWSIDALINKKQ
ncbi:DoxX family protein [Puia sp. P3]|uniref:DoxX family protein n=1 Tax=Puia sp. P3 TaxID=3423952 RepID=UPI003D67858C